MYLLYLCSIGFFCFLFKIYKFCREFCCEFYMINFILLNL